MKSIAVTDHVVGRFRERVRGAAYGWNPEQIRRVIREAVFEAQRQRTIRPHPVYKDQRLAPYTTSSGTILNLCIAPNTTEYPGDIAVVSVIWDREVGETKMGVTLGDKFPQLKDLELKKEQSETGTVLFKFIILKLSSKESFFAADEEAVRLLIEKKGWTMADIALYRLHEKFKIKTVVEFE